MPFLILLVFWGIAFVALWFRHQGLQIRHAERMAALEKGVALPPETPVRGQHAYLLRGLIWLFIGIAISIFAFLVFVSETNHGALPVIAIGLIPIGVGAAYLIVYRVENKEHRKSDEQR